MSADPAQGCYVRPLVRSLPPIHVSSPAGDTPHACPVLSLPLPPPSSGPETDVGGGGRRARCSAGLGGRKEGAAGCAQGARGGLGWHRNTASAWAGPGPGLGSHQLALRGGFSQGAAQAVRPGSPAPASLCPPMPQFPHLTGALAASPRTLCSRTLVSVLGRVGLSEGQARALAPPLRGPSTASGECRAWLWPLPAVIPASWAGTGHLLTDLRPHHHGCPSPRGCLQKALSTPSTGITW